MSLINQMLKDLEARSAPQLDEHRDTIRGITWTMAGKARNKRRYILFIMAISVVCTGIAAGSYYRNISTTRVLAVDSVPATSVSDKSSASRVNVEKDASGQAQRKTARQLSSQRSVSDNTSITEEVPQATAVEHSQVRRMLAALVAQGALDVNDTEQQRQAPAVQSSTKLVMRDVSLRQLPAVRPERVRDEVVVLAENSSTENGQHRLRKTLLPLNNQKLAEMAYQEGYDDIARGQEQAGVIKLKRALTLQPKHSKAREMLAVLYLQQQRISEAGAILTQGMQLQPEQYAFREIYARVLMAEKKLPEAIAMLNAVTPGIDNRPNYYALLAGLYQQNKQYGEAAALYLELIKKKPQYSHWWLGMAISLENMGKNKEAISAYKKARDLNLPAKLLSYVNLRLEKLGSDNATN